MLTKEECNAIIQFLDRTPITGHQERNAMNQIVTKVAQMSVDIDTNKAEDKYPAMDIVKDA